MNELTLKQTAAWGGGKVSARFAPLRVSRMQSASRQVRFGDLVVGRQGLQAGGPE